MTMRPAIVLRAASLFVLLSLTASAWPQGGDKPKDPVRPSKEIQKRTYDFKEAGKEMEYAVYVPSKYDKDKKTPMILALHGLYSNPRQILGYRGFTEQAEKYGYILAAPMGYNSQGWYGQKPPGGGKTKPENLSELSEKDVMNVLEQVRKEFNIDPDRIYLAGHSMGGGGTWHLALKYPDIWAGLAPIAPAIFSKAEDVAKIKHIPVILVQGDDDKLVPVAGARRWAAQMEKNKMTHEYIEVKGGGHIDVAMQNIPRIFEFFEKNQKKKKAE